MIRFNLKSNHKLAECVSELFCSDLGSDFSELSHRCTDTVLELLGAGELEKKLAFFFPHGHFKCPEKVFDTCNHS